MTDGELPDPRQAYDEALTKGRRVLAEMHTDDAAQSSHLDIAAFEQWGYSESDDTAPEQEAFSYLQGKMGVSSVDNERIFHVHEKPLLVKGKHVPATNAKFFSIINPSGGMIVGVENTSPTKQLRCGRIQGWQASDMMLPKLKFWSDVVYLQWKSKAQVTDDLKYIVRSHIVNTKTRAVAEHIVASKTGKERWPAWGDASWDMGSDEAVALLGTPNGAGVAWLLAQHRKQLGHKTIGRIRLIYNEKDPFESDREIPSPVFELCDMSLTTDEIAAPRRLTGSG
jgi:hypothetical protein